MLPTIGKYQILRLLGKGSMGEVYLARDESLGREVAVKTIQKGSAFDDEGKLRFEREARAMAALNHPHIVTIFDFGTVEQCHYLAMEYLEGQDLAALIQAGTSDKRQLLEALTQACEGLGYAHERGIIHRDVKPGNIWVASKGGRSLAKLLDFGVASVDRSSLTEQGVWMGTVSYMAPEYLDSGKATGSADLFAAGVIIYEILSGGRRPFPGDSTTAILNSILRRDPEPLTAAERQGVPGAVLAVMAKALAKEPEQRYGTAEELAAALRQALAATASDGDLEPVQRLVVGKGGGANCLSLRVALRQARPGAIITVLPGTYREAVQVDREVTFQGDGDTAEIILESPAGPCLTVAAPSCVVRGMTLRGPELEPAVLLQAGRSTLEACQLGALQVAAGASATLESCTVAHPGSRPGILVETGASLVAARCQVSGTQGIALQLQPGAQVSADSCQFQASPGGSVELGPGATGRFLHCRFLASRFAGLLMFQGAQATLEDCLLSGHAGAGLHLMAEAQAALTGCQLQDNPGLGLSVVDGGRVSLTDCDLSGNGEPGLMLHRGGQAELEQCRITAGLSLGIACHHQGQLALRGCRIQGNALGGILLGEAAAEPQFGSDNAFEDAILR